LSLIFVMSAVYSFVAGVCVALIVALIFYFNSTPMEVHRKLYLHERETQHIVANHENRLDSKTDCNGVAYSSLKEKFLKDGYVIFRSCSLMNNTAVLEGAASYSAAGDVKSPDKRRHDGWRENDHVMNLSIDPDTLEVLGYLNGRGAFPFQTLNFPVATEQAIHSDVVHFDTLPIRGLMTAAWVALEDIHPDSGPLQYYPGSHKMGLWDMDELSVRVHSLNTDTSDNVTYLYLDKLKEAIEYNNLKPAYGLLKKGETLFWAASLLHGGGKLNNPKLTRLSQVTHYYLTGAKKFWIPRKSIPSLDRIQYKCSIPACTPSKYGVKDCAAHYLDLWKSRKWVNYMDNPSKSCSP